MQELEEQCPKFLAKLGQTCSKQWINGVQKQLVWVYYTTVGASSQHVKQSLNDGSLN